MKNVLTCFVDKTAWPGVSKVKDNNSVCQSWALWPFMRAPPVSRDEQYKQDNKLLLILSWKHQHNIKTTPETNIIEQNQNSWETLPLQGRVHNVKGIDIDFSRCYNKYVYQSCPPSPGAILCV